MKKICCIILALLLVCVTGCSSAKPATTETPAQTPAEETVQETEEPVQEIEEPVQEAEEPVQETEQAEEKLGVVHLVSETDEDMVLSIQERIWVGMNDTELIEKYGLQDASFDDDYELVEGESVEFKCAKDGSVVMTCVDFGEDGGVVPEKECSVEEFQQLLLSRKTLLAYYFTEGDRITEIHELYVP